MRHARIIIIILLLISGKVFCQDIVWADTVLGYSSQKSSKAFSANQVLGKPSKYPNPGHTTCAWSPEYSDLRNNEFLHVQFKQTVKAKQLVIVENFNVGHIQQIFGYDKSGKSYDLYNRNSASPATNNSGRLFLLEIKNTDINFISVKVIFDKPETLNTYQIDAIGLSATTDEIQLTIHEFPDTLHYKSESLGANVNSGFDEVYPIISPDGKTLYFDRKQHPENIGAKHNDDIWLSTFTRNTWTPAINIGPPLNNENHNFLCSISPDGLTALVGSDYTNPIPNEPGVSITKLSDKGWSKPLPIRIKDFVNLNQYNEFTLAADGSTLILSAETTAGNGLLDLYVSFLQADGSYSKPLNLGTSINTAGNEMTPFLAADGKTLYFSSTGFPGYGFQDIYFSKRLDNTWKNWSEPVNLGSSVNTPEWEAYYTIDAKGEFAYFSTSNTTGSNLDIFRIPLAPSSKPENIVWLKGMVFDRFSDVAIAGQVSYNSMIDSLAYGNANASASTGYAVVLPQSDVYRVTIQSPNYYTTDTLLTINSLPGYLEIKQDFKLIPKQTGVIIEMRNILFKINSSILEDSSFTELNKVVHFLTQNPAVEIEIRGHTNSLCDEAFCLSLSAKRAKSVMDYFISQGIKAERLTYKGMGKSAPIADNNTPDGRQKNQRVEFMITKAE